MLHKRLIFVRGDMMNSKIPINVIIDSGSLSLPASPIFQKEKSTYLCPFCVTKLEKLEPKCPECQHKMEWGVWMDKNAKHNYACAESGVL
jgi:hypothetical protein